jgi:hypothetical protein
MDEPLRLVFRFRFRFPFSFLVYHCCCAPLPVSTDVGGRGFGIGIQKGRTQMNFNQKCTLGRTGLRVGRLGISSSFGAPAAAFEEAFERGCNYFNWGTFIKGRSGALRTALRNLCARGKRDELVVGMLTYAHIAWLTEHFFVKGLKAAGLDYADVLLLGWFPKRPPQKIIDGAFKLKARGLVRFIGLTSHNRKLFPELAEEGLFDLFHVRYNAVHRGAETETFPFLGGPPRSGPASSVSPPPTGASCSNQKRCPPAKRPSPPPTATASPSLTPPWMCA